MNFSVASLTSRPRKQVGSYSHFVPRHRRVAGNVASGPSETGTFGGSASFRTNPHAVGRFLNKKLIEWGMRLAPVVLAFLILITACAPRQPEERAPTQAPIQAPIEAPTQAPPEEAQAGVQQQQKLTTTISPAVDVTGNWAGSLVFTNNCPNPACRYTGRLVPPSITMNLAQNGNNVNGAVTVHFANFEIEELVEGQVCGTFQQLIQQQVVSQSPIQGTISSSRLTFADVGGNVWELMVTSDLMQGTISNTEPGCLGIQSNDVKMSRQ